MLCGVLGLCPGLDDHRAFGLGIGHLYNMVYFSIAGVPKRACLRPMNGHSKMF